MVKKRMADMRSAANSYEDSTMSVNERILRRVHELYTADDDPMALMTIAKAVGHHVLAPRRKINVMLIGNHSAMKSSFMNWYVEEQVQKTGMAIETQGFTLITSGKKRETLTGNATLHLYPHLSPLSQITGLTDHLITEISTSRHKKFPVLTLIDTPGLVDGAMAYPFDINSGLKFVADHADLVLVFFDPHGAGTSMRTMEVVEMLHKKHGEKMRFYLTKADLVPDEADRQKILIQITQNLSQRIDHKNFSLPTIYTKETPGCKVVNQIQDVCKEIEKTVNMAVQNSLNLMESDCQSISKCVDALLANDAATRSRNLNARLRGLFFTTTAGIIPAMLLVHMIYVLLPQPTKALYQHHSQMRALAAFSDFMTRAQHLVPSEFVIHTAFIVLLVFVILAFIAKYTWSIAETISKKEKRNLLNFQKYVNGPLLSIKKELYDEYFKQSISSADF